MTLLDSLQWRYATKQFDSSRAVLESDVQELLEAARLSASSYGLQPWKFVVISNPELKAQLVAPSYGQTQAEECSHLTVLCSKTEMDDAYIDRYIASVSSQRNAPVEALQGFADMMKQTVGSLSAEEKLGWMQRQAYIALGTLLTACAVKQIDSCPMEGFDRNAVDEVLGLSGQGLTATLLCPIGYRSEADATATRAKVRFSAEEVIEYRA